MSSIQHYEMKMEIRNGILGAEEDLGDCVDDLGKIKESTAVVELREKVNEVKIYVGGCGDYVMNYDEVLSRFGEGNAAVNYTGLRMANLFELSLFGSQYLLLFFLFCSLYRLQRC
ncbi:hypothetical protein ACJIZ3_005348 [Penstemon smallii]|uniref:Uncharacterized protein n=1 Tax=Penstemon smallii TaxID=265156 RepID=A0ABD3S4N7_9LAMI